jgi:O-antigen ligase
MLFSLVRGAYVGFASSIIYLLKPYWTNRRLLLQRILPVLLLLVILTTLISPQMVQKRFAAIFDLNTGSTQVRLIQWQHALTIAADHPLFGVGWRDLQAVLRQYAAPDPNIPEHITKDVFSIGHFHSNYFTILVCFGVTGLLAFAWLMLAVWRALGFALKNTADESTCLIIFSSRAALIGFLIAGIFDWTFGDAEVVTMLWFVIGIGLATPVRGQTTEIEKKS